jgi:hypothetical protein
VNYRPITNAVILLDMGYTPRTPVYERDREREENEKLECC